MSRYVLIFVQDLNAGVIYSKSARTATAVKASGEVVNVGIDGCFLFTEG
jgi:hypothetical protein